MGKSAGPTPDFQGAAQQQAQSSAQNVQAQTLANRPNVSTPFASQQWAQGPDGTWQLNAGLTGGLGTAATSLGNQAGQSLSSSLDPSLFGAIPNGDAARNQAINAAYGQATSRLNPMWANAEQQQASTLANQGLDPNSQAYRNAMTQFGQQKNDAYNSALNSAIASGTDAGNAVFNNNATAHQMAIADALQQRNAPLQELGQLQGFMQTPTFNQAGAADPTQFLNAANATGNYNLKNVEQQNAMWGDALGALGGLGIGAASFGKLSDERAKTNIRRLPVHALPGVPFATWEWKDEPGQRYVGVIAQDLQKVAPEYVSEGDDGLLRVDYSFLGVLT